MGESQVTGWGRPMSHRGGQSGNVFVSGKRGARVTEQGYQVYKC